MKGRIVILSGPSGVGKDTVIERWRQLDPRVRRVVAYTTRDPRSGEVNGVDYHFVAPHRFKEMVDAGEFLEYKQVHGNFYATPLKDLERMIEAGEIAILKIDVQGALEAMERRPDALSIMLLPPSWKELERRIHARATDEEAVIAKRLQNAKDELAEADKYMYRVVNDDLERAVREIMEIVG